VGDVVGGYKFNGGNPADPKSWEANQEAPSVLENIPIVGGALSAVADIPLRFTQGLASTGKTFTDVFGAGNTASDALEGVATFADALTSAQSRKDAKAAALIRQEAEGKGIWEEVKAAAKSAMYSPLETAASLTGSALPFVAAGLAAPATGGSSLAPIAAMAGVGAVSGVGMIKGDIYDAVKAAALKHNVSDDKAEEMAQKAQEYGSANTGQIALGGVIGAIANSTGISRQLGGIIGRAAEKEILEGAARQATHGLVRRTATGFAEEAVPEGIQAGQERLAQNLAEQNAGYDTDTWKGVAGQAAYEGILGGVFGGGLGAVAGGKPEASNEAEMYQGSAALGSTLANPAVTDDERKAAIDARAAQVRGLFPGMSEETAIRFAANERAIIEEELKRREARGEQEPTVEAAPETPAPDGVPSEPDITGGGASVPGAGEPGVGPTINPEPVAPEPTGVGTPASAPDVPPVGEAPQPGPLDQYHPDAVSIYEAASPKERMAAAKVVANRAVDTIPEYINVPVPAKVITQAAIQMAQRAARGEIFDPTVVVKDVLVTNNIAPAAPVVEEAVAPEPVVKQPAAGPGYTVETAVDEYVRRIMEQDASPNPELEQFIANNAAAINAEFLKRKANAPEAAPEPAPVEAAPEPAPVAITPEPTPVVSTPAPVEPEVMPAPAPTPVEPEVMPAPTPAPAPVEPEVVPAPTPVETTPEQQARAERVANKYHGAKVVYQKGDIGLIRNFSVTGSTLYIPFKIGPNSTSYGLKDVSLLNHSDIKGMTQQEFVGLLNAKASFQAEAAKNKAVKYDKAGVSLSKNIPPKLAGVIRAWKAMLIPGEAVHFTTIEDLWDDSESFGYNIRSNIRGFGPSVHGMASIHNGERIIILGNKHANLTHTLEILAHELGHAHEKVMFDAAPPKIQAEIRAEHKKWVTRTQGMGAKALLEAARTYEAAQENIRAKKFDDTTQVAEASKAYVTSFEEWYADNVAKWATSSKVPLTAVDKFFSAVGKALKKFYQTITGQGYLPNETFAKYMDAVTNAVVVTAKKPILSPKPSPMADIEGQMAEDIRAADTQIDDGIAKVQSSGDRIDEEKYGKGVASGLGNAIKGHGIRDWIPGLSRTGVARKFILGGGLKALPTDGMLDYAESVLGKELAAPLRRAAASMENLNAARHNYQKGLSKIVYSLKEYIAKTGKNILADTMHFARIANVDMLRFKAGMTNAEAYTSDGIWSKYNKLLADPSLTPRKRVDYTAKLAKRQTQIDNALKLWNELDKTEGGQAMYKQVRTMFQDLYNIRRFLIEENLKNMGLSEEAQKKLMNAYALEQEKLADKVNAPSEEDAHEEFPEVPLGLFHKEYFPFKRYGQYWLRVRESKTGAPNLKFFEDMAERDKAWADAAKELGVPKTDKVFESGNDAQIDFNQDGALAGSKLFNEALNIIGGIDTETITETGKKQLQDQLYQLYLLGSPEGAVRKRFMKSKNREGFSADIVRNVATSAEEYATDLARLEYGPQIDRELAASKAILDSANAEEAELGRGFLGETRYRVQLEMNATPQDGIASKLVPWANRWAYLSFLTAPATAMINLTALPIRVAPHLWGKYGLAKTTKVMGKWTNVFKNAPKLESTDTAGNRTLRVPTLGESALVKSNPIFRRAYEKARDLGIFEPMSAFTMKNEKTPATAGESKTQATMRKAYDAMSYLFDVSEQFTREATFMSTFELEYNKLASQGLTQAEREAKATDTAKAALDYTMGNYSSFNRPSLMKSSEIAKAVFLFKQYSVNTTRFFVTSMRTIFGKDVPREERTAAMKEAFGVLSMAFAFAGLKGLPLYGIGMAALGALQYLTDDDEERRRRMIKNPLTANSVEAQFLYEWMPEHFGTPKVGGKDGLDYDLSDIILNGPASEASGWNLGSRVSLDLMSLWWRSPQSAKTWTEYTTNALTANIPGASASLNVVGMAENFNKGEIGAAIEAGFPAPFRAAAKAWRLATEGLRTQSGKVKLAKDDIEDSAIVGAALGFNPMVVSRIQEQNKMILGRIDQINSKRKTKLSAYTEALRRQDPDTLREAIEGIKQFNRETGNPLFMISTGDMVKSARGMISESRYDIQGMGLTRNESYYAQKIAR